MDQAELVSLEKPAYLYGMLFGALLLLTLYNLIRFIYSRSASGLWLAGVNIGRKILMVYAISGICAGIGGAITTSPSTRPRIARSATAAPTRAPTRRPRRCRPTSTGSSAWWTSWPATAPTGFM